MRRPCCFKFLNVQSREDSIPSARGAVCHKECAVRRLRRAKSAVLTDRVSLLEKLQD